MKNLIKFFTFIILMMITFQCGPSDDSNNDCTKTIIIPQGYLINNQYYSYNIEQEVDCDFPDPVDTVIIEPPVLENFTYDVINFTYTPDTGNNTSRLQFAIQLNNNNDYDVSGIPVLTINSDGIQFTGSYSQFSTTPCYNIEANSSCLHTLDVQESLDLGSANQFNLIDVKYYLTN